MTISQKKSIPETGQRGEPLANTPREWLSIPLPPPGGAAVLPHRSPCGDPCQEPHRVLKRHREDHLSAPRAESVHPQPQPHLMLLSPAILLLTNWRRSSIARKLLSLHAGGALPFLSCYEHLPNPAYDSGCTAVLFTLSASETPDARSLLSTVIYIGVRPNQWPTNGNELAYVPLTLP